MTRSALVLVRHGESTWNRENRFTGWEDVPLSDHGVEEALAAARIMREGGFLFDVAFTSYLKRAIKSLWIILEELDQMWIPETKHWALNERHYGKLQGLDKAIETGKVGEPQMHLWRRGWDVPPPEIEAQASVDRRYAGIGSGVPRGESLKDTVRRVETLLARLDCSASAARRNRAGGCARQLSAGADQDHRECC